MRSQRVGIQRFSKWTRTIFPAVALLTASVFSAPEAKAAFIGDYALANFSLINTDADGFANSPDAGLSLILTGGNTGSGLAGTTDLTISATAAGLVAFSYLYSSLDFPGFDYAGYILGQTFVQFADTDGQSAALAFPVAQGETFGVRVGTEDNTGEPGILTITGFTAPSGVNPIPEPGTLALVLGASVVVIGLRAAIGVQRRKRKES